MVPKEGKNSRLSMVAKKPTFLILKMVNRSKKIKKLPGLTYNFCLLQVLEKVNSLEVNEQKDVAKLFKWTITTTTASPPPNKQTQKFPLPQQCNGCGRVASL